MASIVLRKDGRAEIRESYTTPRGPRSRTLAVFRELTERDLEKAERRASRPFNRARILARARKLGVPRFGDSASKAARTLLADLQMGRPLAPTLVSSLLDALASRPAREVPESIPALLPWLSVTDEERGEALRERLHQANRYPRVGADLSKDTPADEKVALLGRALEAAEVPHAFGGHLSLGYYTLPPEAVGPPALFVFEPHDRMAGALAALARLGVGVERERDLSRLRESGRVRLDWGALDVDVYCARDAWHEDSHRRIRRVPFGDDAIWILSAEDLTLTQTLADFVGRDPPADLERLLFARVGVLDLEYVRDWLDRILEPDEPRRLGFEEVAKRVLGDRYLFFGTTLTCRIESEGLFIRRVLVLAGAVELPDPGSEAFDRLARGVPEGGVLLKKANVHDSTATLSGLSAGTYTVVATGYELADPRPRVMQAQRVELEPGVEESVIDFRF